MFRLGILLFLLSSLASFAEEYDFQACKEFEGDSEYDLICNPGTENSYPINDPDFLRLAAAYGEEENKKRFLLTMKQKLLKGIEEKQLIELEKESCLINYAESLGIKKQGTRIRVNPFHPESMNKEACKEYGEQIKLVLEETWPDVRRALAISSGDAQQDVFGGPFDYSSSNFHEDILFGEGDVKGGSKEISTRIGKKSVCYPKNNCDKRPPIQLSEREKREALVDYFKTAVNEDQKYLRDEASLSHPKEVKVAKDFKVRGHEERKTGPANDLYYQKACEPIVKKLKGLTNRNYQAELEKFSKNDQTSFCIVKPGDYYIEREFLSFGGISTGSESLKRSKKIKEGINQKYKTLGTQALTTNPALGYIDLSDNEFNLEEPKKSQRIISSYINAQVDYMNSLEQDRRKIMNMDVNDLQKLLATPGLGDYLLSQEQPLSKDTCDIAQGLTEEIEDKLFWRSVGFTAISVVGCGAVGLASFGTLAVACGAAAGAVLTGAELKDEYKKFKNTDLLVDVGVLSQEDLQNAKNSLGLAILSLPAGAIAGGVATKGIGIVGKKVINSGIGKRAAKNFNELSRKIQNQTRGGKRDPVSPSKLATYTNQLRQPGGFFERLDNLTVNINNPRFFRGKYYGARREKVSDEEFNFGTIDYIPPKDPKMEAHFKALHASMNGIDQYSNFANKLIKESADIMLEFPSMMKGKMYLNGKLLEPTRENVIRYLNEGGTKIFPLPRNVFYKVLQARMKKIGITKLGNAKGLKEEGVVDSDTFAREFFKDDSSFFFDYGAKNQVLKDEVLMPDGTIKTEIVKYAARPVTQPDGSVVYQNVRGATFHGGDTHLLQLLMAADRMETDIGEGATKEFLRYMKESGADGWAHYFDQAPGSGTINNPGLIGELTNDFFDIR